MSQLHQRKRSKASLSDEYETPKQEVFEYLCMKYNIKPLLDIAATNRNTKCPFYRVDALEIDWILNFYEKDNGFGSFGDQVDIWCNPPHSQNRQFVKKAFEQWMKYNMNIIMILPTNTMSSKFWHLYIEGVAEYHPIQGRIRFLVNGKPSKYASRNAYVCVIWRKK